MWLFVSLRVSLGATLFVDIDGLGGTCDDGRDKDEVSETTPLCSVERAENLVGDGDVIEVRRGTYRMTDDLLFYEDGLVLRGREGERPVLDFQDVNDEKGIALAGENQVLEGLEILNSHEECVQVWSPGIIIRDNVIHDCGLELSEGDKYQNCIDSDGDDVLIEDNLIYRSGSHLLYVTGDGVTVRNNVMYGTVAPGDRGSYGIQMGTNGGDIRNALVAHNVILESINRSAIVLYAPDATIENIRIVNNVLADNAMTGVYVYDLDTTWVGTVEIRNNAFADNVDGDLDSDDAMPSIISSYDNLSYDSLDDLGFLDADARDYHLAEGSVLVDAGLSGYADIDFDGNLRPVGKAPDIGAYEWASEPEGGGDDGAGDTGTEADPVQACAVSLDSPSEGESLSSTPSFSWTSDCAAVRLELSIDPAFRTAETHVFGSFQTSAFEPKRWALVKRSFADGGYWRVRGVTSDGTLAESEVRTFAGTGVTDAPPVALTTGCSVTGLEPADGAVNTTGSFLWSGDCDAYRLELSSDPSFAFGDTVVVGRTTATTVTMSTTRWTTLSERFASGGYWRVVGGGSDGDHTSVTHAFTTTGDTGIAKAFESDAAAGGGCSTVPGSALAALMGIVPALARRKRQTV